MRFVPLKLTAISLTLIILGSSNANASIDFWNSNLTWAGQGQCSAEFTFDSGLESIDKLTIRFNLIDKNGNKVSTELIELGEFGDYSANRYATSFVESEEICDEELRLVVIYAKATIDGNEIDLIKTNKISVRKFNPFSIQIKDL